VIGWVALLGGLGHNDGMPPRSAGLLLYRRRGRLEVLLVHPGGPFWASRDAGAWSIPKGEFDPAVEEPADAARREFREETGHAAPTGDLTSLGTVRQKAGKVVHAFAAEGDLDPAEVVSNTFTTEWPPGSGRLRAFPEIDRAAWFVTAVARTRILEGQAPLLDRLAEAVGFP
jgi:predicted NUDIX family NTP pyrophosphohydrolase